MVSPHSSRNPPCEFPNKLEDLLDSCVEKHIQAISRKLRKKKKVNYTYTSFPCDLA